MARARYSNSSFATADGVVKVVPNSSVALYVAGSSGTSSPLPDTIYAGATGGLTKTNPFTTDAYGNIELFLASAKRVKLIASGTLDGTPVTITADYEPVLHDPADLLVYASADTIDDLSINLPGAKNHDIKVAGVSKARFWGSSGIQPGALGLMGGLTIRDHGDGVSLYDQSPTMLTVQKDVSTEIGYTFATFNLDTQATTGDNVLLSGFMRQTGGGATSTAQLRALNFESSRLAGVSTQAAVGSKIGEFGLHLWADGAIPPYVGAAGDLAHAYGNPITQQEGRTAAVGFYLLCDPESHRSAQPRPLDTMLWIGGAGGMGRSLLHEHQDGVWLAELDGHGAQRFRPAAFAKVLYLLGTTPTDYTTAAGRSTVAANDTVLVPTGASNVVYLGSDAPIWKVWWQMGSVVNSYSGGNGTLNAEVPSGVGTWIQIAANMPNNTSVFTDGTDTGAGNHGPWMQSGFMSWAPPAAWIRCAPTVLAGIDNTPRWWVRFYVSNTVSSTNGVANAIRPGGPHGFAAYGGGLDAAGSPALAVNPDGKVIVGYKATATWDPPSLTNGQVASTTVTVPGAAVGDAALASLSTLPNTAGWQISAHVGAANTVLVTIRNDTGGTVDLASGTLTVRVLG